MYLTHRKNGFRFQIAVPVDLHLRLGRTPIRVPLGLIPVSAARRIARLLSGHAERLFIELRSISQQNMTTDPRDIIIAELTAHIDTLIEGFREYKESVYRLRKFEVEEARLATENVYLAEMGKMSDHLTYIADGMQTLEGKVRSLPSRDKTDVGSTMAAIQAQMIALSQQVQTSLDGGPVRPLLSEVLDEWTTTRQGLRIGKKKVKTDYNRIKDFMTFAGDRPLNKYIFSDFQNWANLLARLPESHRKRATVRDLSLLEAADYNDSLPRKSRLATLTEKTIDTNYLSPLRTFFREMAADHSFRYPLADADVKISANASASVERQPFDVDELNQWFAHSACEIRADMKWLPPLAAISGARIGELIFLQGKDVSLMDAEDGTEYWVIDLRTDLDDGEGDTEARKTKTKASRRLIALHSVFVETGFIEYAKSRRDEDWLFPSAFYHGRKKVADPADAASKRMGRVLRKVGIHQRLEKVFHSSRHSAKDIMRLARVDQRTHDLQTGHALGSVSARYGSKVLVREEVEVLASLPLPKGLDLSPYVESRQPTQRGRK
ncbi:hypothetical protein ASD54_09565 [Rhizobium sp. Root149]|uniref:site-specific integrase n=1 Tax=Rhizobium sp. Root149 TaxID=1736473 RepID=UPI000713D9D5|nr:site-specific integrase [Rhizobium sp. Root149]KQZ50472.1 hypothetical protein ASD54_09565 [Rhizobium sp. Root149]